MYRKSEQKMRKVRTEMIDRILFEDFTEKTKEQR